jgi:hypothetical protein
MVKIALFAKPETLVANGKKTETRQKNYQKTKFRYI